LFPYGDTTCQKVGMWFSEGFCRWKFQCNSTLERCKIAKYESSLHSADVFSTYRKFFTNFTN
jgi:hypothetical protein